MRLATFIQQDISWLDVTMKDSVLVRELNRACNFHEQLGCTPSGHRSTFGKLIQVAAFDELHAEITRAVALADFVNRNDLRMLETRRRLGLVTKTPYVRCARPLAETDHFERDSSVEAFLARAIHYALSAAPDLFDQLVIAKLH